MFESAQSANVVNLLGNLLIHRQTVTKKKRIRVALSSACLYGRVN